MTRFLALPLLAISLFAVACNDTAPTQPDAADPAGEVSFAVASNTWITRADMPGIERGGAASGVVPNASGQSIMYVVGGQSPAGGSMSTVQAYNAATNTWSWKAPMPMPLYWTNGIGVIKGKLYISGGVTGPKSPQQELLQYDPATNKWTRKSDMLFVSKRGQSAVISDKLYVVAGCNDDSCEPNSLARALHRYDPATDTWTLLAPPPHTHYLGVAGAIGGKLYVTGGNSTGDRALDVYDPATNRWTTRAPLPSERHGPTAAVLGNKLHVIGGHRVESDGSFTSNVAVNTVYDPATNTWVNKKSMPSGRSGMTASRVVVGGQARIEVVGGKLRPGNNIQYIP